MPIFGPPDVMKLKQKGNVKGLIGVLKEKEEWRRRRDAAEALGSLGNTQAVDALIAALQDDVSDVKCAAMAALQQIGDPRAVLPICELLKSTNDEIQSQAARTLGVMGGPLAIDALCSMLKDSQWKIFQKAANALGRIGSQRAVHELMAWSAARDTGYYTDKALKEAGRSMIEPLGIELGDGQEGVRASAARCLGSFREPRAADLLLAALKDSSAKVRINAARALGEVGNPIALEPLVGRLQDGEMEVRKNAARSLGQLKDARAVPALQSALVQGEPVLSEVAAYALDGLGWQPCPDEAGAWYWLGKAQPAKSAESGNLAIEPLLKFLRAWQCGDLGSTRDKQCGEAVQALDQLGWIPQKDEKSAWYWTARKDWQECIQIGAPAVEALMAAVWLREPQVAEALGEIGDPRAVERLCSALQIRDEWPMRKAAAQALLKMYAGGRLDEAARVRILNARDLIVEGHKDSTYHTDNYNGVCGESENHHVDEGIGLEFPL